MASNNFLTFSVFIVTVLCINNEICSTQASICETHISLDNIKWIHGALDCSNQTDPLIQVVEYGCNTWIFRQSKCVHHAAPFMYLFMGEERALLVDTGATADEKAMPLYEIVSKLLESKNKSSLIVTHTHLTPYHVAGDVQFLNRPNVVVVGDRWDQVQPHLKLKRWPNTLASIDLGNREILVLYTGGYDERGLGFFDTSTRLLLTGDVFFPGRLLAYDWQQFRETIRMLHLFGLLRKVNYFAGAHIEMSTQPGVEFPLEATYHPGELPLGLTLYDLSFLHDILKSMARGGKKLVFDRFVILS